MRGWKMLPMLLVLLLTASTSFAAGFRLPEAGTKAMGMGFAFTAQADDPSAIYFNPAGLTQLKGQNLMVGVTYVRENGGEFTGKTPLTGGATVSETQETLNFFIPNMYYTKTTPTGFAYGVGIFAPFGLGQEYKDENSSIFRNQITKIDLQTIVVNPTIAFKLDEVLSVGLGIDFMYGRAKLNGTPVNYGIGDNTAGGNNNLYNMDMEADATAWGYNFGLLLKPSANFRVGFNYRSPFTMKFKDGDIDISNISQANRTPLVGPGGPGTASLSTNAFGGRTSFSGKGSTTLNLPATATLGAAYTVGRLTVEADADWTFWGSYKSLDIERPTVNATVYTGLPAPYPPTTTTAVVKPSSTQKEWNDVCAIRIGAEYRVTEPLALRAGFVYDPSPVPANTMSPELPDADRLNYMVGAGYKVGPWTIDGAFMYIDKRDRTINNQTATSATGTPGTGFNGTWSGDAWLLGLDVGYAF
ncbi:MAG: outer membrane protein transport protein [bacterium]|jgi:long-chain fatty acid transport protein